MKQITQTQLKSQLHYNPETGIFTWKVASARNVKIGDIAGTLDKGYIRIQVSSKVYRAHRLAFLYMTGEMPEFVDHIDHNGANNIWTNLREATNQENNKNASRRKDNSSGFTGVLWNKQSQKWQSYIAIDGKQRHLGLFVDKDEAINVRKEAEIKYGYHKNHGQERR